MYLIAKCLEDAGNKFRFVDLNRKLNKCLTEKRSGVSIIIEKVLPMTVSPDMFLVIKNNRLFTRQGGYFCVLESC